MCEKSHEAFFVCTFLKGLYGVKGHLNYNVVLFCLYTKTNWLNIKTLSMSVTFQNRFHH